MPARSRKPSCVIRCGCVDDLNDLCELERQVFADDNMSRRSLRHFLVAASAEVVVAEHDGRIAGCAVVLFRPNSLIARLYSIAVAPHSAGRGLGPALLIAAERAALAKRRQTLRLGGARAQSPRDRALPQGRLSAVRPALAVLPGPGRRVAV
jgi:ribosomal protein S18 acetylase RimI-like enzyme